MSTLALNVANREPEVKTIQRIRRTPMQWRAIFTQFEAGSLSATAFCKQQGIAYGSFMRWRQRVVAPTGETTQVPADDWVPIQLTAGQQDNNADARDWDIELVLPGGVQLRMRAR